ncbi:hypothetical protein ACFQ0T_06455 [Kitasatospora gansuensis]
MTDDRYYSGKLVRRRDGRWVLMGFHHTGPDGTFTGGVSDPVPIRWDGRRMTFEAEPAGTGAGSAQVPLPR